MYAIEDLQQAVRNLQGNRTNISWLSSINNDKDKLKPQFTPTYEAMKPRAYQGPSSFVVSAGDTLRSIAQAMYGTQQLWYKIAEANGLSSDADLKAGQVLTIPGQVSGTTNGAGDFRPYDASAIVGDTTPNMPAPPKDDGCGILGQIIMLVVAIVVAVLTGPQNLALFGQGVMGYAGAAALGSIASQMVGMAIGAVDSFSWKAVALAALSAGITQGVEQLGLFQNMDLSPWMAKAFNAMTASALTQGIAVATGLQDKFSWRGVAAAGVGAAVGYGLGRALGTIGEDGLPTKEYQQQAGFGEQLLKGTAINLGSGLAGAVVRGGRVNFAQIAADAFGNALGSAIVGEMAKSEQQEKRDAERWSLANYARQNGLRLGGIGLRLDSESTNLFNVAGLQDPLIDQIWNQGGAGAGGMLLGTTALDYAQKQALINSFSTAQKQAYDKALAQNLSTDEALKVAQMVEMGQRVDAYKLTLSRCSLADSRTLQRIAAFDDMRLAYDSYFKESIQELLPPNVSRVDSARALQLSNGLAYVDESTGFASALYRNSASGHYTLAFRGTDDVNASSLGNSLSERQLTPDGRASFLQAYGKPSPQYDQAVDLASALAQSPDIRGDLSFTGHSLGGGLAAVAAMSTRLSANTFNASGIHPATAERYKFLLADAPEYVTAYNVKGDWLTSVQDGTWKGTLPLAMRASLGLGDALADKLYPERPNLPPAIGYRQALDSAQLFASPAQLHSSPAVLQALYQWIAVPAAGLWRF